MGGQGVAHAAEGALREATLGRSVSVRGAGLHTGHGIRLAVCGAGTSAAVAAGTADWIASRMSTALDIGQGRKLRTIEHLMAALAASRIDNAAITVEGTENPLLDGSAARWCARLKIGLARRLLPAGIRDRLWTRSFDGQTVRGDGPEPTRPQPQHRCPIGPDTDARMHPRDCEPLLRGTRPGRVAILLGGGGGGWAGPAFPTSRCGTRSSTSSAT